MKFFIVSHLYDAVKHFTDLVSFSMVFDRDCTSLDIPSITDLLCWVKLLLSLVFFVMEL